MELLTQFADLIKFLIDFILHIDVHLAELVAQYGTWVYAILFLIIFVKRGLLSRHSYRAIRYCLLRGLYLP